jgi:hypothetical protein
MRYQRGLCLREECRFIGNEAVTRQPTAREKLNADRLLDTNP